ncbi:hypothetical protein [Zhongshania sp.]|uniref:hypothetical protein n=1 Tax=Zhongshania sp. TaxID=1971902 RepID=UPI00356AD5EC
MANIIVVDLDGTLCDHPKAREFTDETWSWAEFSKLIPEMVINDTLDDLIAGYTHLGNVVNFVTARPWFLADATIDWLWKVRMWEGDGVDKLYCAQPTDDAHFEIARKRGGYAALKKAHARYKLETIRRIEGEGNKVRAVFEDNPEAIKLLREEGYQVFGVDFKC